MSSPTVADAERYVASFAACWQLPDAEAFLDGFCRTMHADIRLVQPLVPPSQGHQGFRQEFLRLRKFVPDLRGEVKHWAWSGEYLYIELELSGTLGKRRIAWPLVDRFRLDAAGLCLERISYFDPLPLILRICATPSAWPRLLSSGMLPAMLRSLRPG